MGWQDLLSSDGGCEKVLPWIGGKQLYNRDETWIINGELPVEHGWYVFKVYNNRKAELKSVSDPDPNFEENQKTVKGYLVGDRLIPDNVRVDPDPDKLIDQTHLVFLVEPGLDRFARAVVVQTHSGFIYSRQEFPQGPEAAVLIAYQDRKESIDHIVGITPALDLAFRWVSRERILAEEYQKEYNRRIAEEEKRQKEANRIREIMKSIGTGLGRRNLAEHDFDAAAKVALQLSGAEFLDSRKSYMKNDMIVQYRFRNRRFECVVNKKTLQIVDSGICLNDHRTGETGDTYFTLESLPGVVGEAIDKGKLVVYRHIGDDYEDY